MNPKEDDHDLPGERRRTPRIYARCPAMVWSIDVSGNEVEDEALLDSLGAGGLSVRLPRQVKPGEALVALICFTEEASQGDGWPRVATCGTVVRSEETSDGFWDTAVRFDKHVVL